MTAIDVRHVCAEQAAEAGDLVKAGIKPLCPHLAFAPSASVSLSQPEQVHAGYNLVGQRIPQAGRIIAKNTCTRSGAILSKVQSF